MPSVPTKPRISLSKKILFSAIACLMVFLATEVALWLGGVRTLLERDDPLQGFSGLVTVFEQDGDLYRTRPQERYRTFNEQSFLVRKPSQGFRFFCLGGSSAYGFPWGADVAFTAVLGDVLAAAHPERAIEAVNAAGVSYAMHRLRIVANEILEYEPDFIVIYCGHNEFVEPAFFDALKRRSAPLQQIEYLLAHSRIYTSLADLLSRPDVSEAGETPEFGMFVRRNESLIYTQRQKEEIGSTYRENLQSIVRLAHQRGVKVLLATIPCNLRDWLPNESILEQTLDPAQRATWAAALETGRAQLARGEVAEAVASLRGALELAPRHAETHYLLAQACEGLGYWKAAREAYERACDDDASPTRRLSAFNEVLRQVASEEGTLLVDVDELFAAESEHGLVGFNWIEDYVHPNPRGHELIAWFLWKAIEEAGWLGKRAEPSREFFAQVVGKRAALQQPPHAGWFYNQGVVLEHQGHIEQAVEKYRQALAVAPHAGALVNLAGLLLRLRQFGEAERSVEALLRIDPEHVRGRMLRARLLIERGLIDEAIAEYRHILSLAPETPGAHTGLVALLLEQGRMSEAKELAERAAAAQPEREEAALALAAVLEREEPLARAIERYRSLIARYPSSATAHERLGLLLCARGDVDEGVRTLRFAGTLQGGADDRSRSPGLGIGFLAAGQALLARSDEASRNEAAELFEQAREHGVKAASVWLARIALERGDDAEAERRLQEFFARGPYAKPFISLADAHLRTGILRTRAGRLDEAEQELEAATPMAQALIATARGDSLEGRILAEVMRNIDEATIRLLLARGNAAEAEAAARRYLNARTEDPLGGRRLLADVLEVQGRADEAAVLRRITEAAERLGKILNDPAVPIEEVEERLAELRELGAAAPGGAPIPRSPVLLVRAFLQRGLHDRAIEECSKVREALAANRASGDVVAETWFLEGEAHRRAGRGEKALACYAKAAELAPAFRGEYERLKGEIEAQKRN
ncbi:MAG: tetratricopeptide repeat protein [Planctomycetota bacterium]